MVQEESRNTDQHADEYGNVDIEENKEEKKEVPTKDIDRTLSTMHIHLHNVWAFHHNVVGSAFFTLHAAWGRQYKEMVEWIDRFSENMRANDLMVKSKLSEHLELSDIEEKDGIEMDQNEAVQCTVDGLCAIGEAVYEIEIDCKAFNNMLDEFAEWIGSNHWQFKSFLK